MHLDGMTLIQTHHSTETSMIKYVIGIDCGVNTGFAVQDQSRMELIEVTTLSAHEAWNKVRHFIHVYGKDAIYLRYEDAHLREWLGKAGKNQLQGAGSIKRDSSLWEEFCEMEGLQYDKVAPKHIRTKCSTEYFKRVTGWKKATNEHGRDAAMMIYQFRPIPKVSHTSQVPAKKF